MKNKYYKKKYFEDKHHIIMDVKDYDIYGKTFYRDYIEEIGEKKVFEFGCGLGANISLFYNAVGYDISKYARDFCRKKGLKIVDSVDEIEDNSIDLVILSQTLEHLENPIETLRILKSKLKPNGKLILLIPAESHYNLEKDPEDLSHHLFAWNRRTIVNLVNEAGFIDIKSKYLRTIGQNKLLFVGRTFGFPVYYYLYRFLKAFATALMKPRVIELTAINPGDKK